MSTATQTPRDSTTAQAPQLRGWVEIFRAGNHKDSKGRDFAATEADLDEMVRNHELGAAPAVIGHPKQDGPAFAWVGEMARKGASLFAKFTDINPAFDDGVALGAYRNRSVSIVRDAQHGLRVRHVGWLGGVPPAIDGLSPTPANFSAADADAIFEFASTDDALSSLGWSLGSIGQLLRGLREYLIESAGAETADRVIPTWHVDQVVSGAQAVRDALHESTAMFSTPTPNAGDPSMPHITQEQLDAAVAQARREAEERASAQFSAQGQELAELRSTRQREVIAGQINGWKAKGLVTPAEEAGLAEFMAAIDVPETFSFSVAGTDASKLPLAWFADFMSARQPVIKLGRSELNTDPQLGVDLADADSINAAANQFMAEQEKAGKSVTHEFAVQHVVANLSAT